MTEVSTVNIVNQTMLEGVSRNMPFNIPNEAQSIKSVSKNMPFNYDAEVYYNYNSKGEKVRIHQVGSKVNIIVL